MLIFNTTFVVSDKMHDKWMKWVREQHLPFMLESDILSKPQIAKIMGVEEQDGTSYSVQFHVKDMNDLEKWHVQYAQKFELQFSQKFGSEVLFFATVLEIIE